MAYFPASIMARAWVYARASAKRFGGRPAQHLAAALRQSWAKAGAAGRAEADARVLAELARIRTEAAARPVVAPRPYVLPPRSRRWWPTPTAPGRSSASGRRTSAPTSGGRREGDRTVIDLDLSCRKLVERAASDPEKFGDVVYERAAGMREVELTGPEAGPYAQAAFGAARGLLRPGPDLRPRGRPDRRDDGRRRCLTSRPRGIPRGGNRLRHQDIRLSRHFTMLDLMQCRTVYSSGRSPPRKSSPTPSSPPAASCARGCWSPSSGGTARAGCRPAGGPRGSPPRGSATPHRWGVRGRGGTAADVRLHDRVNAGAAPAMTRREMMAGGRSLTWLITYAGSEFVCVFKGEGDRGALYENILRGDGGKFCKPWCHHRGMWPEFLASTHRTRCPGRQLREDQAQPHCDRTPQPQHVRAGRYFTLLDLRRSEEGLRRGVSRVPPVDPGSTRVRYARMAAELLDPVTAAVGRLSVTGGVVRPGPGDDPRHRRVDGPGRVAFLLPAGAAPAAARDALGARPEIREVGCGDHPSGAVEVAVVFEPFEPARTWSSRAPACGTVHDARDAPGGSTRI